MTDREEYSNPEYHEDYEESTTIHTDVFCKDCFKKTKTKFEDFGIGSYEYWGAKGVDTNVQEVTECCEAKWWEYEDSMLEHRQDAIENTLADNSLSLKAIEAIEKILEEENKNAERNLQKTTATEEPAAESGKRVDSRTQSEIPENSGSEERSNGEDS